MAAAALGAQVPARIDFQRDVQPIFREHCIGCHGPDQQLSGLRLDRRADAMRGGCVLSARNVCLVGVLRQRVCHAADREVRARYARVLTVETLSANPWKVTHCFT